MHSIIDDIEKVLFYPFIFISFFLLNACGPYIEPAEGGYPEPLEISITEFYACRGHDTSGKPVGISDTFSPQEEHIYACGRLETNHPPVLIAVNWYKDGQRVFRQNLPDIHDYFYSEFKKTNEQYPIGDYRIQVIVIKNPVKEAYFSIIE